VSDVSNETGKEINEELVPGYWGSDSNAAYRITVLLSV
jgi:hypothetical protein